MGQYLLDYEDSLWTTAVYRPNRYRRGVCSFTGKSEGALSEWQRHRMEQDHMASIMVFLPFYCTNNFCSGVWTDGRLVDGNRNQDRKGMSENGVTVDVRVTVGLRLRPQ